MSNDTVFQLGHTTIAATQWLSVNPDATHIVMLHGWLDNAASFATLAPELSDFSITALDLAGHGKSKHRPDGCFYHLWDYVLDVIAVLKTSTQNVWLLGHSMGGAVAMLVAAMVPDKVRGLVILDSMGPATATPDQRVTTMQRSMQKMLKKRTIRSSRYQSQEALVHARMHGFTELSYEAAKPLVERGATFENGVWKWRTDHKLSFPSPFRMDEASVEAYIQAIKCPTLALVANQGIFARQQELVEKRAKAFPWIKLKRLEGNHHFHLEPSTSACVAQEIHRFIDQN